MGCGAVFVGVASCDGLPILDLVFIGFILICCRFVLLEGFVPLVVSFFNLLCTTVTYGFNRFKTAQYQGAIHR